MNIDRRAFLAAMASIGAVSMGMGSKKAVAATESDWPMYGYDEIKSRNNPDGEKLPDGLSNVAEIWVSDGRSESGPVTAGETVYVGFESGEIEAINSSTGNRIWSRSMEESVSLSPSVKDESVYISNGRSLYALDASTGETEWNTSLGAEIVTAPTISADSMYVGTASGMHSLSTDNGSENWSSNTDSPVGMSPVVIDEKTIFATVSDLYCLNRYTGVSEWQKDMGGSIEQVVAEGTRVYTLTNSVRTFFVGSGAERWGRSIRGNLRGSPAIYNGNMYIGTDQGVIQKLNLQDRGALEWVSSIGGEIRGSPLVVDGVLYTVSAESPRAETGTLHAVDPQTGDSLGTVNVGYDVNRGPTIAYGKAYLSTESGVYGYGEEGGPTASFEISPSDPSVGDTVSFDASSSSAGNYPIQSYDWEFDSPTTSFEESGSVVETTLDADGEWEVSLTVTDTDGLSDTEVTQVTVTESTETEEGAEISEEGGSGDGNAGNGSNGNEVGTAEESGDGGGETEEGDEQENEEGLLPASVSRMLPEGVSDTMAVAAAGGVGAAVLGGLGIFAYSRRRSSEKDIESEDSQVPEEGQAGKGNRGYRAGTSAASTEEKQVKESRRPGGENTGESDPTYAASSAETGSSHKGDKTGQMNTCPECGARLDDSIIFCTECGTNVEDRQAEKIESTESKDGFNPEQSSKDTDEDLSSRRSPGQPPESDTSKDITEQESPDETTPVGGPQSENEREMESFSGERCPECGEEAGKDSRFCISCGTDLEERSVDGTTVSCPDCGTEVNDDNKFCISCGANLEGHGEVTASICPECGTEVDGNNKFCISCGAEL